MRGIGDVFSGSFGSLECSKTGRETPPGSPAAGKVDVSPDESSSGNTKIVIVLPSLSAGGSERTVSLIANHWVASGHSVTIVTLERVETQAYYPISTNVQVVRLGIPTGVMNPIKGVWFSLRRLRRLRTELRKLSPDLVISFLTRTNILTLFAMAGGDIRVIVSERNHPNLQKLSASWAFLRRLTYPTAYGLVTMTRDAMECFPRRQRPRSWVIPNASTLPGNLADHRGGNILTAVGRLVPQKGFDLLLAAFAKICRDFPDWTLVIYGEGHERRKLEQLRDQLGLPDRVKFPGVSDRPGSWIETTDVFVQSSRFEGWGIVLLEAMAAGLPVVSFDCEFGPREMITNDVDGLLVPNGDVAALSAALARMVTDGALRQRLGEQASVSAKRFSHESVMAQWDEVVASARRS